MKLNTLQPSKEQLIPTKTVDAVEEIRINQHAFHRLGFRALQPQSSQTLTSTMPSTLPTIRPALFAKYQNLNTLRYDFPLVLSDTAQSNNWIKSLADVIDDCVKQSVDQSDDGNFDGEMQRQQLLNIEQNIKDQLEMGQSGLFSDFWNRAQLALIDKLPNELTSSTNTFLSNAFVQINTEGSFANCDEQITFNFFKHIWVLDQTTKAKELFARIIKLETKLSDILRIEYLHTNEARSASKLENYVGTGDKDEFNFEAMANILQSIPVGEGLPEKRESRIRNAIKVLQSQTFVSAIGLNPTYNFCFKDLVEATSAYFFRLDNTIALVKALSIGELEIENLYNDQLHDNVFENFHQGQLTLEDQALFPTYLVYLEHSDSRESRTALIETLQSGLPFKIIAMNNNVIGEATTANGQNSFGMKGQQLARMVMGLNNIYTFQSSVASLYPMRNDAIQGISQNSPALFSIYSGRINDKFETQVQEQNQELEQNQGLANYLVAASATDSRAFPSFVFDPEKGSDLKSQFSLLSNPCVSEDWIEYSLNFEDAKYKSISDTTSFTPIDFIACQPLYREYFSCIPKQEWSEYMVPAAKYLTLEPKEKRGKIPFILVIDDDNKLHRAIVDIKIIDAANHCVDAWHNFQELDGINNSYVIAAEQKLAEKQLFEKNSSLTQLQTDTTPNTSINKIDVGKTNSEETIITSADTQNTATQKSAAQNRNADDPWIDSIRCTTCNECTELNDRMFSYDDDLRAFIADPTAGTYKEMVEAAENCQVAIIHPGKPIDENEPNLKELKERAKSFQ